MRQVTIFGYENFRYFVPAGNPHGHATWFKTRAERDVAVRERETQAAKDGLDDPTFRRVRRVIKSASAHAWLASLQEQGDLRGQDAMSHTWGPGYWKA